MDNKCRTVGDRIKFYREKRGISKSVLAKKIGRSPSYITMLENNERKNPTWNVANEIAIALDIPVSKIIEDKIDTEPQIEKNKSQLSFIQNYPSGVNLIEDLDNIRSAFDKFASNEYLQKRINYKYSELDDNGKEELFYIIIEMLNLKMQLFKKYGSDAYFTHKEKEVSSTMIYQYLESIIKLKNNK